jgi:hypothetical protein
MSRAAPVDGCVPARMVPPYTMILGRFKRPMAMMQPGMFLSHPGRAIKPSYHCAPMVVSIESAIKSRDCKEKRIPVVPMEIPSLTPMVLKRQPTKSASWTPCLTYSESSKEMHVARISFVPDGTNPDLRLPHVLLLQTSRVQHGLWGTLRLGFRQNTEQQSSTCREFEFRPTTREQQIELGRVGGAPYWLVTTYRLYLFRTPSSAAIESDEHWRGLVDWGTKATAVWANKAARINFIGYIAVAGYKIECLPNRILCLAIVTFHQDRNWCSVSTWKIQAQPLIRFDYFE